MKKKLVFLGVVMIIMMSLMSCATFQSQPPRPAQSFNFTFDGNNSGSLEVKAEEYIYCRGNKLRLVLPNPEQRFQFFVRELVEAGKQKPPFSGWMNAEYFRVLDEKNIANISFFVTKTKMETVITNRLRSYAGSTVFSIVEKTKSEVRLKDNTVITKETLDININNNRRVIVFVYWKIDPATNVLLNIWSAGLYGSNDPIKVADSIITSSLQ